ncbi:MAG TPA: hypothetical protein VG322_17900 [Candidatus Acidoferrales bacterium]|nr:hypothetical protein [Candidatus Acidoferrales bacterium]
MSIKKRPMSADGKTVERRRSRRFPVAVPLEVSWRGKDGASVKADAVARQVNANGGFVKMSYYPDLGARVTLANFLSAQTAEARVLAGPPTREGVSNGIIVELIEPNDTFWGVNLQSEKAAAELHKLEKAMQSEGIDFRLLKEYRDAVEFIRSSATIVQQLRECHLRGSNDTELLSLLATERIRRAINSCLTLMTDLDSGRVKIESKDVDELYQALEQLTSRLRRDCQKTGDRLLNGSRKRAQIPAAPLAGSSR